MKVQGKRNDSRSSHRKTDGDHGRKNAHRNKKADHADKKGPLGEAQLLDPSLISGQYNAARPPPEWAGQSSFEVPPQRVISSVPRDQMTQEAY